MSKKNDLSQINLKKVIKTLSAFLNDEKVKAQFGSKDMYREACAALKQLKLMSSKRVEQLGINPCMILPIEPTP